MVTDSVTTYYNKNPSNTATQPKSSNPARAGNSYYAGGATAVTLSEMAKTMLAQDVPGYDMTQDEMAKKELAMVIFSAHLKLGGLLNAAHRTSPLEGDQLALDLSSLSHRELYAMATDASFAPDRSFAGGLELQRRLEAALAGPLAIANVTGEFTGLYQSAAAYFDTLGSEEKASSDWRAARAAIDRGLEQLAEKPDHFPDAGVNDPVALYVALVEAKKANDEETMVSLSASSRVQLDRLYEAAYKEGKIPSFSPHAANRAFIDISVLSSRNLSAIVLDEKGQFSHEETKAAQSALYDKNGEMLTAGLAAANQSNNPVALSQNVMAAYNRLSPQERQTAGWSPKLYQAAATSYATTRQLMRVFDQFSTTNASSNRGLVGALNPKVW